MKSVLEFIAGFVITRLGLMLIFSLEFNNGTATPNMPTQRFATGSLFNCYIVLIVVLAGFAAIYGWTMFAGTIAVLNLLAAATVFLVFKSPVSNPAPAQQNAPNSTVGKPRSDLPLPR